MVSLRTLAAGSLAALATVASAQEADAPVLPDAETVIPLNAAQPRGALTGATIFVNPGHGWIWNGERWVTQRSTSHGIIEDHSNAEAVMQYLVPYLHNAGANVYTTRERCLNTNMVLLEAQDDAVNVVGAWDEVFATGAYGGSYLEARTTTGEPDSVATFRPDIPADGQYAVYLWYRPSINGPTAPDVAIDIRHSGGTTTWTQNLNHDDRTWKYVGSYWFEAGAPLEEASLVITNASEYPDHYVTIDAVRFGGGMGSITRNGKPSGKPRWEESGIYYAQFAGYQEEHETRPFNSVSAMPMLAEREMEPHEAGKSVYIGWHTNASGSDRKVRGFSSYIYGPNSWGPVTDFTGYPGGNHLCLTVHERIMEVIHGAWDAEWRDIGTICRWLGETNPRNNNAMPAALFEYGFHDDPDDAAYILDPRFRDLASRSTYQGIVRFFAGHMEGFDNGTFLPERPVGLTIRARDNNTVAVAWDAPPFASEEAPHLGDPATGYRVHLSQNGWGFDEGIATQDREMVLNDLPGDRPTYIQVTAENAGGRSFPSETLVVRPAGDRRALLVNAFDRLDKGLNLLAPDGKTERGILRHMNTRNYVLQHAEALDGWALDSASNESIGAGDVDLSAYQLVVYLLGQEEGETVLPVPEREALAAYLEGGGAVFLSGSEVAGSLVGRADDCGKEVLHLKGFRDDARSHTLDLGGRRIAIDNTNNTIYPVKTPDALLPQDDAEAFITYATGDASAAGIVYTGDHRVALLGVPLETIVDPADRAAVMDAALARLLD